MDQRALGRKRIPGALIVLAILGLGLALVGAVVPWLDCAVCGGAARRYRDALRHQGSTYPDWKLACIACRDRGTLSWFARVRRGPMDPDIAEFARVGQEQAFQAYRSQRLSRLFQKNGLDAGHTLQSGPLECNWFDEGFVESGTDAWYLVALSTNEAMFDPAQPKLFPGRMFLFDLRGRLIDHLEIVDANGRSGIRFHELDTRADDGGIYDIRVFLHSELSKESAEVDLIRGQERRRLLSGLKVKFHVAGAIAGRIFVRNGRLEVSDYRWTSD